MVDFKELRAILEIAKHEEEEGLWEATENTSDLMAFLSKHGKELLRLAEKTDDYERLLKNLKPQISRAKDELMRLKNFDKANKHLRNLWELIAVTQGRCGIER